MTSLREIRSRLRSVENIKKIAQAMERVAATRLRRAQLKAEQARPYVARMRAILEDLAESGETHPLFQQREVKKSAVIVIAADKGLSGTYNSNVLHAADRFIKRYDQGNLDLFLFGRKAIEHYQKLQWPIVHRLTNWGGNISLHEIEIFSNQLVHLFLSGKYDEIWLIYTHYISILRRQVLVEKFLNIGKIEKDKKTKKNRNYIFEPDPLEIYAEILPRYCMVLIQTALQEAYASELAARIVAMQTAGKNSENMIRDLTLVRNKVRQEGITKEIIEISSSTR